MIKNNILAIILILLLLNIVLTAICRKTLCIGLALYILYIVLLKNRWDNEMAK